VHAVDPAADGPASGGLVAAVLEYYRRYTARALGGADSLGVSVFAACGHRFSVDDPRAVFESCCECGGQVWVAGAGPEYFADCGGPAVEYQ